MSLTIAQTRAIEITERVTSVFSLLGVSIIIITFLSDNGFRKPINRLVFYAAWGNILSNVATIVSVTGIYAGQSSPLCQAQSFLIQWFLPADALWSFCMALNVYLTFVHKFDAQRVRSLEWMYFLLCYGLPFIPAFTFFFIRTESRGRVYGSAVLWCWISLKWDYLRIALFYGPVWFVIFTTLIIYILCGRIIFKWRRQLLNFAPPELSSSHESPIVKTAKTEVYLELSPRTPGLPRYTVEIAGGRHGERKSIVYADEEQSHLRRLTSHATNQQKIVSASNRAAVNYCRVALLFFVALCITWIPSTINRVYSLVRPESVSFPLAFASALVLPLQGLWNAVIYVTTSWPACRACVRRIWQPRTLEESMNSNTQSKQRKMLMETVGSMQRNSSRARTTESEEELRTDK